MTIKQFKSQFECIKSKIIAHEKHVCLCAEPQSQSFHVRLNLNTFTSPVYTAINRIWRIKPFVPAQRRECVRSDKKKKKLLGSSERQADKNEEEKKSRREIYMWMRVTTIQDARLCVAFGPFFTYNITNTMNRQIYRIKSRIMRAHCTNTFIIMFRTGKGERERTRPASVRVCRGATFRSDNFISLA